MGYLAKGDRITQSEQDLIDIIGVLGSPLQVLRVTADGLSLEYATASGDVSKVGTPANNQVGVWTGDGTIEGDAALTFDTATDLLSTVDLNLSGLTASELIATNASKTLVSLAVATYPSLAELAYVKGVTSSIQTQLNGKQASGSYLTSASISDTAYGVGWDTVTDVAPSKNAVYDEIENRAVKALSNLASVAINTTLVSDTDNTDALGTSAIAWSDLYLGSGAVIVFNSAPSTPDVTITHSANTLTIGGGDLALGSNNLSITGSIASTGSRVTKGWYTDLESTNMPTVGGVAILSSLTAPQFTTIELGHATQNTLSASGGILSIEGNALAFASTVASKTSAFVYIIDGGGSAITTGSKGSLSIPAGYTITGWRLVADASGDAVVDVKKSTYAGFPTTSSICGADKPTLSTAQKNENLSVTLWTTAVTAGDVLEYVVDSASTVTRLTLTIVATKT